MRYVVGLPFSALSLILCSIPSSAATVVATQETTSVQVFADFLTETDIEWCQGAAAAAAGKEANYVYGGAPRRLHSPVVLDQDLYTRIYAAMLGDSDQVDAKQGDDSSGRALLDHVIEDTNLIVSTLTDTTDSHMDCYDVCIQSKFCWSHFCHGHLSLISFIIFLNYYSTFTRMGCM